MDSELDRLQSCLKDLADKPIGRPAGSKTKPQPPREGPTWEAFKAWFYGAQLARPSLHADLWRAFAAGAGLNAPKPDGG
jgi:hypothetical protein